MAEKKFVTVQVLQHIPGTPYMADDLVTVPEDVAKEWEKKGYVKKYKASRVKVASPPPSEPATKAESKK